MDVELTVKQVIVQVLKLSLDPKELSGDTPLRGKGLQLDSLMGLQIILALENEFGFQVLGRDLTRDVFTDINHLVDFVRRKQQAQTVTAGSAL